MTTQTSLSTSFDADLIAALHCSCPESATTGMGAVRKITHLGAADVSKRGMNRQMHHAQLGALKTIKRALLTQFSDPRDRI